MYVGLQQQEQQQRVPVTCISANCDQRHGRDARFTSTELLRDTFMPGRRIIL